MDTQEGNPLLPDGMPCPGCGYDVGGQAVRRCPECGRALDAEATRVFVACRDFPVTDDVRYRSLWWPWLTALGLGVLGGASMWSWGALMTIGGCTHATPVIFTGLARPISRVCPAWRRNAMEALWLRQQIWLSSPATAMLCGLGPIVAVGLVSNMMPVSKTAYFTTAAVVGLAWLVWSLLVVPIVWWKRFRDGARVLGVRGGREMLAFASAATVFVPLCCCFTLLAGGLVVFGLIQNWTSLKD